MEYSTAPTYSLNFVRSDASEKFDRPAVLTAGSGPTPDYSQLALKDIAVAGSWRAQVPEIVAKALRVKPPYIPPAEETTSPAPIVSPAATEETAAAGVDTNPPGSL